MYNNNYYNNGPDWIMVPTIDQVEQVTVQPGQKAWIMVQNEPVFALKVADNMGLAQTDLYRFEKYIPKQNDSNHEYVTKAELESLVKDIVGGLNESTN